MKVADLEVGAAGARAGGFHLMGKNAKACLKG